MTGVTEAWSGPWHALQRTLAAGIGGHSPVAGSAAVTGYSDYRTAVRPAHAPGASPPPRSWLRKAHARVCEPTRAGAVRAVTRTGAR